jgi:hypothetical protein
MAINVQSDAAWEMGDAMRWRQSPSGLAVVATLSPSPDAVKQSIL